MTLTAAEWKIFYRDERARLGEDAMRAMIARAPRVEIAPKRALIFPHTRLEITGTQIGAVVKAIVASRVEDVLAIGVLHGKSVDEEFSLDAFDAMLALAARDAGRAPPRVRRVFPESRDVDLGRVDCAIVATADMIHHGVGYGRAKDDSLAARDADAYARGAIDAQLRALAAHDFDAFAAECERARSDFRRSGPVLARAMGRGFSRRVIDLELVDYASALGAESPTWVAGALIEIRAS